MKVGIMGAGSIAGSMAKTLNGLGDEAYAYAVASRDIAKAQAFADKWGILKVYGSYEELAADPEVDLIYIATPHAKHYECAKMCLNKGRNVLCEKPLTSNCREAKELFELAESKGLYMIEAVWTRFMPIQNTIREILSSGRIGTPEAIEGYFNTEATRVERMVRPELAGGALLDLGIYSLTFGDMYFGDDIESVRTSYEPYETGVDAFNTVEYKYKDGRTAKLVSGMTAVPGKNEGTIYCTEGSLWVDSMCCPQNLKIYNKAGELIEHISMPHKITGYEYEVMASKKYIADGKLEAEEITHAMTLKMMGRMDTIKARWGMLYPYEQASDLESDLEAVWGKKDIFE